MSLTKVSYSMVTGAPVNVFDYLSAAQKADVLANTASIDCRAEIQTAMTFAWLNQRALYVPGGTYLINSVGPTYGGKVYGLWLINGIAGPGQYEPFRMFGDGYWVTQFVVNNNVGIDRILGLQFNGQGCSIADIGISAANSSGVSDCLFTGSGTTVVDNIWTGGGKNGFHFSGGPLYVSGCTTEYASDNGFFLDGSFNTTISNSIALQSAADSGGAGILITQTAAQGGANAWQMLTGISIVGCAFESVSTDNSGIGASVIFETGVYMPVHFSDCSFGNLGFGSTVSSGYKTAYGVSVNYVDTISFTNCDFSMNTYGNIVNNTKNAMFTGCTFVKSGYLLGATSGVTWAVRDLSIGTSNASIVNCSFSYSAGSSIYTGAGCRSISIIGNSFINTQTGGLNVSGVAVNTALSAAGNAAIDINPSAATDSIKIIANNFDSDTAYSSGKYGIRINCATAVPSANNVTITSNTNFNNASFQYKYVTPSATALQANSWLIFNDALAISTPQNFPSIADANAPNSTLYYSTTASKLVWKDSGGSVNNLY